MSYEFNKEDNLVFSEFSLKILIIGILVTACGFFFLLYGIVSLGELETLQSITIILESVLFMGIGIVFILPNDNFKKIATTEDSDIPELMKGFKEFSTGFRWMSIFLVIIVVLDIILAIISLGAN